MFSGRNLEPYALKFALHAESVFRSTKLLDSRKLKILLKSRCELSFTSKRSCCSSGTDWGWRLKAFATAFATNHFVLGLWYYTVFNDYVPKTVVCALFLTTTWTSTDLRFQSRRQRFRLLMQEYWPRWSHSEFSDGWNIRERSPR